MFKGYNKEFPYSYVTEKLVEGFPSWTKVRKDPNSIGQQFLNVFGLMMEEVERYLDESLNNQYIGSANIGEVDWVYKLNIEPEILRLNQLEAEKTSVEGYRYIGDKPVKLPVKLVEMSSLHDFYASKDLNVYIVDYEENIIYLRYINNEGKTFDSLKITTPDNQEISFDNFIPHHIWNVFDEFALLLGLRRRHLESNAELKERILDVFRFPANATKIGLLRGVGRELGLIKKECWRAEADSHTIDDPDVIPETIIIRGAPPLPGQIDTSGENVVIRSQIAVFPETKKEAKYEGVSFTDNGELILSPGVSKGYYISPILSPRDLLQWKSLTADFDGDISFDVVVYNFEDLADPAAGRLISNMTNKNNIFEEIKEGIIIDTPVRIVINLERMQEASPVLRSVKLDYVHRNDDNEEDVSYIYGIKLNTLHDEEFLSTLFNSDGSPGETLLRYVKELTELVPIMWGSFRWDESYWDVVGKNLMGLHVLPNIWDPRLSEVTNELFQAGIGDGLDLKVRFGGNWCPQVHNGHYYLTTKETLTVQNEGRYSVIYTSDPDPQFVTLSISGIKARNKKIISTQRNKITFLPLRPAGSTVDVLYRTKHYLFADCKTEEFQNTDQITLENKPAQDTVLIVEADGRILKEVSFLNPGSFVPSIVNKETIKGTGREDFYLKYGPAIDVKINGEDIDSSLVSDNAVLCTIPLGDEAEVEYKVKDSFVFYYDENKNPKIILSDTYDNIKVYYEGASDTNYYQTEEPSLNPIKSHITSGFLYLTNQIAELDHFDIGASPDAIRGDGISTSLIVVDAFDAHDLPVLNIGPGKNKEISVDVSLVLEGTEEELPSSGEVIHRATYYNRNVYVYKSPPEEELPDREDGSGRKKPCTAIITFTCGSVEEKVTVEVR